MLRAPLFTDTWDSDIKRLTSFTMDAEFSGHLCRVLDELGADRKAGRAPRSGLERRMQNTLQALQGQAKKK